jgi:hypothetical protein
METYESNSHKSRGDKPGTQLEPAKKKEVKQVTNTGKTKKKSILQKIFIPEDVTDVKEWIVFDILIPGARNLLLDTINEVLGGGRRTSRNRSILGGGVRYTNYSSMSGNRQQSRRRSGFDYDDIIVETSQEAHDILNELDALMEQYHVVSLADLYSAAGVSCDYTYNNYGWKDISDARVVRDPDGWILKFPRAVPID